MKKAAWCLMASLLLAGPAAAQEKLQQVFVTQSDSGEVLRGRLVTLSPASLALLTGDNRRVEIPLDRVLRVETHGGDSLKNGAAIGAAVFGGLVLATCASWGGGGECIAAGVFDAGLGALVGAGIDAMVGRSAIYSRPAAATASKGATGDRGKAASIGFRVRF